MRGHRRLRQAELAGQVHHPRLTAGQPATIGSRVWSARLRNSAAAGITPAAIAAVTHAPSLIAISR